MTAQPHSEVAPNAATDAASRVRTSFTLPTDLHRRVKVRAAETGVSMESIVENALAAYLLAEASR